jgi:hypothetical protein
MKFMLAVSTLLVLNSCATYSTTQDKEAPPLSYEDELRQAAKVMATQAHLVVRYNPVKCSCPPFEIQIGSRWVRVAFEKSKVPNSAAAKLNTKAAKETKQGAIEHYKVKGELDDSINRCAGRSVYLSVAISEPSE